jgi:hypothetical protein
MIKARFYAAGAAVALTMALSPLAAFAADTALKADLSGKNETGGGDANGTGKADVKIDSATHKVTWNITSNVADAVMAHIHKGAAGADGPVVVNFADKMSGSTDVAPDVAAAILANPADYYVNVHSKANPKGAVRGQLAK